MLCKLTLAMYELVAMVVCNDPHSHQPWNDVIVFHSLVVAKNTIVKILMSVIELTIYAESNMQDKKT